MLKFEHANIGYGECKIVKQLNLSVSVGQRVCILGPSGSGKTTILKALWDETQLLGGILKNTFESQSVIFQYDGLFEWLTVRENLEVAIETLEPIEIERMANKLGIGLLLDEYCSRLSGGQKQRVQIMRALLAKSELLIIDEPTSSLDMVNKRRFVELLLTNLDQQTAMILVTHDLEEAVLLSDYIYIINQGHICKVIENVSCDQRILGNTNLNQVINQIREVIINEVS